MGARGDSSPQPGSPPLGEAVSRPAPAAPALHIASGSTAAGGGGSLAWAGGEAADAGGTVVTAAEVELVARWDAAASRAEEGGRAATEAMDCGGGGAEALRRPDEAVGQLQAAEESGAGEERDWCRLSDSEWAPMLPEKVRPAGEAAPQASLRDPSHIDSAFLSELFP